MVTVLCGFVVAAALLSAFVFGGNVALSLIAAAAAAGVAVFDLLLGKRKRWARAASAVLGFCLLGFCFYVPSASSAYGYDDYLDLTEAYMGAKMQMDDESAEAILDELVEKYGEGDDLLYLEAVAALSRGDLDGTERIVNSFADKHSRAWYMLREDLIVEGDGDDDSKLYRLRELYMSAAADNPGWIYALQRAGGLLFDEGKYAEAAYYLTNAVACSETPDPDTLYFLGASLMEQGEYEQGLICFRKSVDAGAEKDLIRSMVRYAEKAGIEVKYS